MTRFAKISTYIVTALLGALCGLAIGHFRHVPEPSPVYICDTIVRTDTLTRIVTDRQIVEVRTTDTIRVAYAVTDTIRTTDTLYISLPREQRVYADSSYRAVVSGYLPRLDSISVYQRTQIVTRTPPPRRWGIGVSAGYAATSKGLAPYIGLGLTYDLFIL